MTPTRSVVAGWQALDAASQVSADLARRGELIGSVSNRIDSHIAGLGGSSWSGKTYDAARDRVDAGRKKDRQLCDQLDTVKLAAHNGLSELHYSAQALLGTASDAEADGCLVSNTWVVTAGDPAAEDAAAKVTSWASFIGEQLAKLQQADERSAQAIAAAATELPTTPDGLHGFFPLIIGAADLAVMAAMAAGVVTAGGILLWAQHHMPAVPLSDLLNVFPSQLTSDGGPGEWIEANRDGMSDRAKAYEEQVTGSPAGTEYAVPREGGGDVKFDGWDGKANDGDGTLIEAKGPGYSKHLGLDGEFKDYFSGADELRKEMERQYEAAEQAGKHVDWRVAEPEVAEWVKKQIAENDYGDLISVEYVPPKGK